MVHKQVQPLLALGLEGLEEAKQLFVWRLTAHSVALVLAIFAAWLADEPHGPSLEFLAAGGAILFELTAFYLHQKATDLHGRGRQVMRRVITLDALSPEEGDAALQRSRRHFSAALVKKATDLEARDRQLPEEKQRLVTYYYSRKPPGQARLRDHLLESAIFSHHLYAAAWRFSLACLIALLAGGAVVVTIIALGSAGQEVAPGTPSLLFRLLIALVAFVPACQEVDHLLLYRAVEHQLSELLHRVERLYSVGLESSQPNAQLLADLGDYCAATTFAPPIRTLVYRALVDRLVVEFEQKMRDLEGAPQETRADAKKV